MQNETQILDFSTVLASCIHDMKNSLSMLLSKVEDISHKNHQQQKESDFDQLKYEGKRVNDHLMQLLVLYRVNQSQYFANIDEIEMKDFLEESLSPHRPMLEHRNIDLSIECEANLYWYFDRDLLEGVLTNIMNNLYIYTKSEIHIVTRVNNKSLTIQIKDDGSGYNKDMLVSPIDQQKEFNFKSGSTGLGLYFASIAAKMHNNKGKTGYITITNDGIDGGGCFSITLP